MSVKKSAAFATLAASLALATPGRAAELNDWLQYITLSAAPDGIDGNQVVVMHDGDDWVDPGGSGHLINYRLTVEAETTQRRIKIIQMFAGIEFDYPIPISWPAEYQVREIDVPKVRHLGPKNFVYPYYVRGLRAVNACRRMYDELKGSMSHEDILGEDRFTSMDQKLGVAILAARQLAGNDRFGERGYGIKEIWSTISVKCLKAPRFSESAGGNRLPTGPDGKQIGFAVTKIELGLAPDEQTGVCPAPVGLRIDVFGNTAGVARVRVKTSGPSSPIYEIPVESHPSGGYVGTKIVEVEVGKSVEGGPLVGVGPVGGGGNPGDKAVESEENVHTGVYWVESTTGVKSDNEGYKVTCTPPPFEPGKTVDTGAGQTRSDSADADQPPRRAKAKVRIKTIQQIAGLDLRQPAGSAKPDLTIKSAQPAPGNPSALRVLVENAGGRRSGPTNLKLVYSVNGQQMTRAAAVQPIAPGRTIWVIVQADTTLVVAQQVALRVDDPNRIVEAKEDNNGYFVK